MSVVLGVILVLALGACPSPQPARYDAQTAGDAGPPVPTCAPTATGTTSITEGEAFDIALSCATGEPGAFELLAGDLPLELLIDEAGHLLWRTDLDDAIVLDVAVRERASDERLVLHLAIADALGAPGNVPPVDPLRYTEELGLPVLFVSAEPRAEVLEPVEVIADGHRYIGTEAKLRGASSLGYPKRSFTIKFADDERFRLAPRPRQVSADAFIDKKKIVLISTFDDTAAVRQRLSYQVWNRTRASSDHAHVNLQTSSVVVYLGGAYHGLYTLADHVDRELFEESLGLDDEGQLYKSVNHDANFRRTTVNGDPKGDLSLGWERRDEPDLDVIAPFTDLNALTAFVSDADDAIFRDQLSTHINVDDVVGWWIFATAILAEDSYGKNAYLYRPVGVDGAPAVFRYAPWDFNHAFGQAWETSRTASDVPVDEGWPMDTNQIWQRLLTDAQAGFAMRSRYAAVLDAELSEQAVLALFEAMVTEVDAAARKDLSVWGEGYQGYFGRPADFDDEVALVRGWISARWQFLRAAMSEP
jgi:hypothetical protein